MRIHRITPSQNIAARFHTLVAHTHTHILLITFQNGWLANHCYFKNERTHIRKKNRLVREIQLNFTLMPL